MEIKTIEQIKEEYAKECGYDSWQDLYLECLHTGVDAHVDSIATRYASQFQTNTDLITTEICVLRERVAELEESHGNLLSLCKAFGSNSDWIEIKEAESLINKGKDNGN